MPEEIREREGDVRGEREGGSVSEEKQGVDVRGSKRERERDCGCEIGGECKRREGE